MLTENCRQIFKNRGIEVLDFKMELMKYLKLPTYIEPEVYFYHPEHLGSNSWITSHSGRAIQYLNYLPFGEDWVNQ